MSGGRLRKGENTTAVCEILVCCVVVSNLVALWAMIHMRGVGVEPTSPYGHQILSLARLPIPPPSLTVVRLEGIEPSTSRLRVWCSTNWAKGAGNHLSVTRFILSKKICLSNTFWPICQFFANGAGEHERCVCHSCAGRNPLTQQIHGFLPAQEWQARGVSWNINRNRLQLSARSLVIISSE